MKRKSFMDGCEVLEKSECEGSRRFDERKIWTMKPMKSISVRVY